MAVLEAVLTAVGDHITRRSSNPSTFNWAYRNVPGSIYYTVSVYC